MIPAQLLYWPHLNQYACGIMFRSSELHPTIDHIFEVFHGPDLVPECELCNYPKPHFHPDMTAFTPVVNIATGSLIWTTLTAEPTVRPPRHPQSWQARSRN